VHFAPSTPFEVSYFFDTPEGVIVVFLLEKLKFAEWCHWGCHVTHTELEINFNFYIF